MSATKRDNLIVGLDIGTTKICAIVGNVTEEGIDIVGNVIHGKAVVFRDICYTEGQSIHPDEPDI